MENSIVGLIIVEIIVLIIFSLIIGNIGSRRQIGFMTAFFLSLFLTPIVGLLVVFSSDIKNNVIIEEEGEGVNEGISEGVNDVGYSNVGYSNVGYKKENDFGYNDDIGYTNKKSNIKKPSPVIPKLTLREKIHRWRYKIDQREKCKDFL